MRDDTTPRMRYLIRKPEALGSYHYIVVRPDLPDHLHHELEGRTEGHGGRQGLHDLSPGICMQSTLLSKLDNRL